jgi:hypothetical protein
MSTAVTDMASVVRMHSSMHVTVTRGSFSRVLVTVWMPGVLFLFVVLLRRV